MYTYKHVEPSVRPPFKTKIRRTRGEFVKVTGPCGVYGFRYAIFKNRASEIWIPVHDLTTETKALLRAKGETL